MPLINKKERNSKKIVLNVSFPFSSYAAIIPRKFGVRYNAFTQTVEVLDSIQQLTTFTTELRGKSSFFTQSITALLDQFNLLLS